MSREPALDRPVTESARRAPLLRINTFVWHSPITTDQLADVSRRIAGWGYDAIEIPLENEGDWEPHAAQELFDGLGLTTVVGAVMAPGRELAAAPKDVVADTQRYLRHCVDVAAIIGARSVIGPIYTSVGRTWRMTEADRATMMQTSATRSIRSPTTLASTA